MKALDAYLPSYDVVMQHAVTVDAESARIDRAMREVTYGDVPLVRALLFARGLGWRPRGERVLATMVPRARVLEDVPGEGIVVTLTGHFWRLTGGGSGEPAKAVVDFRAERRRLTTETRVRVPRSSRRPFARYWFVVRPFSGLIRKDVLRAAKRRAERQAG